jgi:hypothetical protein
LDKALARQLRPVQIAERDAVATDVEFTRDSNRHWLLSFIENVSGRIGDGPSDGH